MTKMDALEKAANEMAQSMYQNAGGQQQSAGTQQNAGSTGSKSDDDVVDADFKEKK